MNAKTIIEKTHPKNRIKSKIEVKLPHVNKKPLTRKRIFVKTPFSQSAFKLEQKTHTAIPLAFFLDFLFWRDHNHYSNLTSKIMRMCEQIFKKTKPDEHQKRLEGESCPYFWLNNYNCEHWISTNAIQNLRKNRNGIQKSKANRKKN